MRKVFITYSHADEEFVDRVVTDLEFSGLSVTLDKRVLKPGDSLMKIFEQIGYAGFLVPILSGRSVESDWVKKELRVAIIKEIEESEFKVVPIVKPGEEWEKLKKEIPGDLREALRDTYLARFDAKSYHEAFQELVEALSPDRDPEKLYAKIEGPKSDNPFRRVRTEYFENVQILARSFAEPESVRYDRIMELKPTRIEGGRGSGKTMILKSLEATVSVYRRATKSFKDAQLNHFGVYCRLIQGAFVTQGGRILDHIPLETANRLFMNELILQLVHSLIDTLQQCSNLQILVINGKQEGDLAREIADQIRPSRSSGGQPIDLRGLKRVIQTELRSINDYVSRRIMSETPSYSGVFLTTAELREICKVIPSMCPDLGNTTVYFLLDEYENLLPFQKIVVNSLIKWSESKHFTMKIATKKAGFQDPQTLEGQELEESHDYGLVDLDYDISNTDHRRYYKDLLTKICQKILHNERFAETDIQKVLEDGPPLDGFEGSEIDEMIASMVREQSGKELAELDEQSRNEYRHRLEVGALYRLLRVKKKKKQFAGFDDFLLLSSGIIRYFLELCGMSYYLAVQDKTNVRIGEPMTAKQQTNASYTLSSYYLATIRKNIAQDGPRIQQFVTDLGDIFRQKLLNHLSEPEAARVSIADPQALEQPAMSGVKQLLDIAEMHSVFQVPGGLGGIRPKHATEVQPREYVPNRIYAPVLQFSPRPRWRTSFNCRDITGLLDPVQRKEVKARLMQRLTGVAPERELPTLFDQQTGG